MMMAREASFAAVMVAVVSLLIPTASAAEDHAAKPVAAAAQHDTSAWATSVSVHSDKAAETTAKPEATKAKPASPQATKAAAPAPAPVAKPQTVQPTATAAAETKPAPGHAPVEVAKPAAAVQPPAAAPAPPHAVAAAPPAAAAPATAAPEAVAMPAEGKTREAGSKTEKPVHSYCVNITNTALDARYLRQKKFLDDLKEDVKKRTGELENTIATYKEWLKRRDEFVSKAQDSLVAIYGNMKSEAAAKQLSELEEETASSVLAKLDARQASGIMAEMDSKKAARLMEIIAGAGKFSPEGADSPPAQMKQASTEADAPEADFGVQ